MVPAPGVTQAATKAPAPQAGQKGKAQTIPAATEVDGRRRKARGAAAMATAKTPAADAAAATGAAMAGGAVPSDRTARFPTSMP